MKIITIPGSKSLTNRALILAALADGKSVIKNFSKCNDSQVMIKALKKLKIEIIEKDNQLIVIGNGGKFKTFNGFLDVGEAGTTYRFLTALTVLIPGKVSFIGSKRLMERPIDELKKALLQLKKGKVSIKGGISSQFISALLMIAPVLPLGLIINIEGNLVSKSYIDMTIDILKKFGVKVLNKKYKQLIVKHQKIKPIEYTVEADASGASYFFAIAAVTGKTIRVIDLNPLSKQGDIKFPDLLEKMGCLVKKNTKNSWIEVKGRKNLKAIEVDMNLMPDTAPTLAVVASFIKGKTKITGLSTLKNKESDRLQALKNELNKIGIRTIITDNSITIFGGNPKQAEIETYNDHRIAMAFAVAKSRIPEIKIKNPDVVKKSFPDFWEKFTQIL